MQISIVIPCYNGAKFARECIDAALNQTYKDVEVIVLNDASTDDSLEIIKSYGDKIIYLSWNINKGTAYTLNQGVKTASGEFIKWCSIDDVLLPQAIETMMWFVLGDLQKENTIYYTNYHIIDKHGKHKKDWIEPKTPPDLWKRFYGNGSTTLIHKSVFKKCGLFDESLRHSEDYEFWLRATQIYGVHLTLMPIFTINYRNHPDQLTNKVGGSLDKQIKDSISKRLAAV